MTILDALAGSQWAIESSNLEQIRDIAIAHSEGTLTDWLAMSAEMGKPTTHNSKMKMAGPDENIAVISIEGSIFPKANMMTQHSGATSAQATTADLIRAQADPNVKEILFEMSTPGGLIEGSADLAQLIYSMRGQKRMTAHVAKACSAGLWIASACDQVFISPTGLTGSLGAIATLSGEGKKLDVVTNTKSPNKHVDPHTPAGREKLKAMLDSMYDVFANDVARFRGMTLDQLEANAGGGDVFIGADAVKRGFADQVATFEETISQLSGLRAMHSSAGFAAQTPNEEASASYTQNQENAGHGRREKFMNWFKFMSAEERKEAAEALATAGVDELTAEQKAEALATAKALGWVEGKVEGGVAQGIGAVGRFVSPVIGAKLASEGEAWADKLIQATVITPAERELYSQAYGKLGALVMTANLAEDVSATVKDAEGKEKSVDILTFFTSAVEGAKAATSPLFGGLSGGIVAGASALGTPPKTEGLTDASAASDADIDAMVAQAAGITVKRLLEIRAAK